MMFWMAFFHIVVALRDIRYKIISKREGVTALRKLVYCPLEDTDKTI